LKHAGLVPQRQRSMARSMRRCSLHGWMINGQNGSNALRIPDRGNGASVQYRDRRHRLRRPPQGRWSLELDVPTGRGSDIAPDNPAILSPGLEGFDLTRIAGMLKAAVSNDSIWEDDRALGFLCLNVVERRVRGLQGRAEGVQRSGGSRAFTRPLSAQRPPLRNCE
jgi:hypothetical protein